MPSFGTQITFKPNDRGTLNSSSFIGTDTPDSARLIRYFHNFYAIFQISNVIGLTVGLDYGLQQRDPQRSGYNRWLSSVVTGRFTLSERLSVDARAEYYQDEYGVIIETGTTNGFKTTSLSTNVDYKISANAVWRIELRNLASRDPVFIREEKSVKSNTFITTSLAVSF